MPRLEVRDNEGTVTVFPLGAREIVVGRQPDCDIVLNKNVVSRRHARIYPAKQTWAIADLKSSHGTFVNGERIDEKVLSEGDAIRIGEYEIVYTTATREHPSANPKLQIVPVSTEPTDFAEITAPRLEMSAVPAPPKESARTTSENDPEVLERRRMDEGDLMRKTLVARDLDLARLSAAAVPKPADTLGRDNGDGGLMALVRISDGISRCTDIDMLCKVVTEMALKASGADRGVIALKSETGGFVPRAQMAGKRNVNAGTVKISTTFVDRVLRDKEAMIARDVGQDVDLSSARSIVALDIRSVVCVPLLDGEEVRGYLYLDRIGAAGGFSPRDLDLLCLIGYHAAAAIGRLDEQARRHTMSRFFSADVIRHLEEESRRGAVDPTTSTRAQLVTVLFSDIQGFTTMSENMDPRALKTFLDAYFDHMTEILVDRHGGTLDKYIGDGIMALFGAPYSKGPEVDARNAVAAGLDMLAALDVMRAKFPHYGDLQMRIGINSGKVIAGMMGSKRRFEYSVLGDAVNVASRLESSGAAGRIQIGDTTHVAVKNTFDCEFAGERKMKNRAEPVKCWWVTGRKT